MKGTSGTTHQKKTGDGHRTITKIVNGPMGLLMTTTADALHEEDENRMLSYVVKSESDKIKAALLRQNLGGKPQKIFVSDPWFELHEHVGNNGLEVDIPFYDELVHKLPDDSPDRIMRDFPKVRDLIRAHALMHQETRERRKSGAVIATIDDDYKVAHALVAKPLARGIESSVPEVERVMVEAVAQEFGNGADYVIQTQLAKLINRNQSVVSRHWESVVERGYLATKDETPGQGR